MPRILVIDDDSLVLRMVARVLQRRGYEVVAVGTAEEALARLLVAGAYPAHAVDLGDKNATCLAAMFGADTEAWKGHRVTLFATMVQLGRRRELGIRVKGSPDLAEPLEVVIELPRKKPVKMMMHPTARGNGAPAGNGHATARAPQEAPAMDVPPSSNEPPPPEPGWEG